MFPASSCAALGSPTHLRGIKSAVYVNVIMATGAAPSSRVVHHIPWVCEWLYWTDVSCNNLIWIARLWQAARNILDCNRLWQTARTVTEMIIICGIIQVHYKWHFCCRNSALYNVEMELKVHDIQGDLVPEFKVFDDPCAKTSPP